MLKFLNDAMKLQHENLYQVLFALSMVLYHSTEYFTVKSQSIWSQGLILSIFDHFNVFFLQVLIILVLLAIFVSILVKIYISKTQNYTIQINQKILYPIQVSTTVSIIKFTPINDFIFQTTSKKVLTLAFYAIITINTIVIILKHFKINLRYQHSQKGFNRISNIDFYLFFGKFLIQSLISIHYPSNTILFILFGTIINLLLNVSFIVAVIYENPKIEFLYLVTQFYQWMPLISLLLTYHNFGSPISIAWLNFLTVIVYFALCMTKPKILVELLQKKYLKCLKNMRNKNKRLHKAQKVLRNLLPVLSIYLQMFFRENSKQKLQWSINFKSQLLYFLNHHQVNAALSSQSQSQGANSILSQTIKLNFQKVDQQNQQLKGLDFNIFDYIVEPNAKRNRSKESRAAANQDYMSINEEQQTNLLNPELLQLFIENKANPQQETHKKLMLYQLLWKTVQPYLNSTDPEYKDLRFYVSYNFPDTTNLMKTRLFYSYYFNNFTKLTIFNKIQASICQKHLLKKISQQTVHYSASNLQRKSENFNQVSCIFKQDPFTHQKFTNILEEQNLRNKFIQQLQFFTKNEKHFSEIFQNVKEHKENVRVYYQNRRISRLKLEQLVSDYEILKFNSIYFVMIINYIKEHFLNKNPIQAYGNLLNTCQNLSRQVNPKKELESSSKIDIIKRIYSRTNQDHSEKHTQKQNSSCVISGLSNLGKILIPSSKFKFFMQIENEPDNLQLTNIRGDLYIDKFIPSVWRDKHSQAMNLINHIDKPIHHSTGEYLMLSLKGKNLISVKFNMYFFMKYETDLLIVLDFYQQKKIDSLILRDAKKNIVFTYGVPKSNLSTQKMQKHQNLFNLVFLQPQSCANISQFKSHKVQAFGQTYEMQVKQNQSTLEQPSEVHNHQIHRIQLVDESIEQSKQQKLEELKFIKYKSTFGIYNLKWYLTITGVALSVIFFGVGFQLWINKEKQDSYLILDMISDKMFLQDKFITFNSYSLVDIGALYNVVQGIISFNPGQELQKEMFISDLFIGISFVKSQTLSKYSSQNFIDNQSPLTNLIFNPNSVPDYNISFSTQYLIKEVQFFKTLQIFADLNLIDQIHENMECRINNKECKNSQMQPIILPKELDAENQLIIGNFLWSSINIKNYNFDRNGFIQTLLNKEKQIIHQIKTERKVYCFGIMLTFFINTVVILSLITWVKKSILQSYNHSVRISERFLSKFDTEVNRLQNLLISIKGHPQLFALEQIFKDKQNHQHNKNPENKLSRQQSMSKSYYNSLNKDRRAKIPYRPKQLTEKDTQLNLHKYLVESIAIPLVRLLIIVGVSLTIYLQANKQTQTLKTYSQAVSHFAKLNSNMIGAMGMILFEKKIQSFTLGIQGFKTEFQKCMDQIKSLDKANMVKQLFPYDPQIAHRVVFDPISSLNNYINLPPIQLDNSKSPIESFSSIMFLYQHLFIHLKTLNFDMPKVQKQYINAITRTRQFVLISDRILEASLQFLQRNKLADYNIYLIVTLIILFIEFCLGFKHFSQIINEFNDEYLNIASLTELKNENGYKAFTHLSNNPQSILSLHSSIEKPQNQQLLTQMFVQQETSQSQQ